MVKASKEGDRSCNDAFRPTRGCLKTATSRARARSYAAPSQNSHAVFDDATQRLLTELRASENRNLQRRRRLSSLGGSPSGDGSPTNKGNRRNFRTRAMSETCRGLFVDSLDPFSVDQWRPFRNKLPLAQCEPRLEESAKTHKKPTAHQFHSKTTNRIRNGAKGGSKRIEKLNYFAAIGSDEEDDDYTYENQLVKSSRDPGGARSPKSTSIAERLIETVIEADEHSSSGWTTITPRSQTKPPRKGKPKTEETESNLRKERGYSHSSEDDLYDLQQTAFGVRDFGSGKKPMQYRAVEKRKYAIEKRDRQRRQGK